MKIIPLNVQQYINMISELPLQSVFQIPQYHYLQELIHPGEYRFEPFKMELPGKFLLVPLLTREKEKGFPEYIVPFNSLVSDQPVTGDDYAILYQELRRRRPFRIRISSSLDLPSPITEANRLGRVKISRSGTYIIDLPQTYEAWLEKLSYTARYKIRKAIRRAEAAGLEIRIKGSEGLDDFLELFYQRFQDQKDVLNTLPALFFHKLFEIMPPGSVQIYEAFYDNKVIAACISLCQNRECFAQSSAFDKEYKDLCASDVIQARMIKDLIEKKFERYNMGGTGDISSLSLFKQKFAASLMEYQQIGWRNPLLGLWKSCPDLLPRSFKIQMHFMMKNELAPLTELSCPELPPLMEWFALENEGELDHLIAQGYNLNGADDKGKLFMSEKIARTRLSEKQILILMFRKKIMVHTRSLVLKKSLPLMDLVPPIPLSEKEVYAWHANATAFFRQLGYHKLSTAIMKDYLKQRGIERIYMAVRENNIPALKAQDTAGSRQIGSFHVIRWRKHFRCIATAKVLKKIRNSQSLQ